MEKFQKDTSLAAKINKYILGIAGGMLLVGSVYVHFMLSHTEDETDKNTAASLKAKILEAEEAEKSVALAIAVTVASNSEVVSALETNDRERAIVELNNLGASFKNGTPYKNVQVHIHTKDIKSFVRDWKHEKFGDDLSSFRESIVKVSQTKKPLTVVEVGVAGLVLRGIAPIMTNSGEYVGSVEAIMGYNSIVKEFKKQEMDLLVLMDGKIAVDKPDGVQKVGDFILSQKDFDEAFKAEFAKLNLSDATEDKVLEGSSSFIVLEPIKDLNKKVIGQYAVGISKDKAVEIIDDVTSLVLQIALFGIILLAILVILVSIVSKKLINESLVTFNSKFNDFVDFLSYRTNKYTPAEIVVKDEFGELLNHLNQVAITQDMKLKEDMRVIGEIVLVTDKVEQGIYRCRIHSSSQNPMVETLKQTVNNMIEATDKNMTELRKTLELYTQDDFRHEVIIDPKLKSDMLSVMQSVNKLGDALRTNAKLNLTNGETLNQNAITMSESVNNVAAKANQQAASLEETAAALEEITSITRNNAQNAVKMAGLGNLVNKAVNSGQELANKTAHSMEDINHEVMAINEAIKVIDQIAFQTNILSLNAAVEAATAGEAGKGFAVVAGEVRNLANRSADAANEIKALVESAASKANDGKNISDEMIKGYQTLNTHINETIRLIEDVSNASKEQMQGIEQINDAVTILDRVTQENASEANNVSNIASEVRIMADELVSDAKSKKF
jgi:methyl-accepting chemotaxis protein